MTREELIMLLSAAGAPIEDRETRIWAEQKVIYAQIERNRAERATQAHKGQLAENRKTRIEDAERHLD